MTYIGHEMHITILSHPCFKYCICVNSVNVHIASTHDIFYTMLLLHSTVDILLNNHLLFDIINLIGLTLA